MTFVQLFLFVEIVFSTKSKCKEKLNEKIYRQSIVVGENTGNETYICIIVQKSYNSSVLELCICKLDKFNFKN